MTKITFKKPINHEGKTYEFVEIDEPSVGSIEAFEKAQRDGGDTAATLAMLAVDTGIPADALRKLKVSDLVKISDAIAPFIEALKPKDAGSGAPSALTSPTS